MKFPEADIPNMICRPHGRSAADMITSGDLKCIGTTCSQLREDGFVYVCAECGEYTNNPHDCHGVAAVQTRAFYCGLSGTP